MYLAAPSVGKGNHYTIAPITSGLLYGRAFLQCIFEPAVRGRLVTLFQNALQQAWK